MNRKFPFISDLDTHETKATTNALACCSTSVIPLGLETIVFSTLYELFINCRLGDKPNVVKGFFINA